MRRFAVVLAVCLMFAAFAMGLSAQQSSSSTAPQPQAQPSQPSPSQSPSAQPAPRSGDLSVGGCNSSPTPSGQQQPNSSQSSQPARAGSQGGLPWGWIVIGIIAVVILIALATRGPGGVDRSSERLEKEHPDDIRRAG